MLKTYSHSVVLALVALATPLAWADLPDCGNEGQRVCKITDFEFYNNATPLPGACEVDLVADGGVCRNMARRQLHKDRSWLAWALMNQRYQIGGDLPINYITTVGAHNAHSNVNQGNTNLVAMNQKWSVTDLLQQGMRYLEIDPHFYGGHLRLCHASETWNCLAPAWSSNRLYSQMIREIANWLEANPGEFVVVKLDDHLNGIDLEDHIDAVTEPIEAFLGPKVLRTYEKPDASWPTMNHVRASGKQIMFLSRDKDMESRGGWVFNGNKYFPTKDHPDDVSWSDCKDADGVTNDHRPVSRWTLISEGRSVSNLLDITGLFNGTKIRQASGCGFSTVALDFVNALQIPGGWGFGDPEPDDRLKGAVWSWKENDRGELGPALFRYADGYWESQPQTQLRPYVCGRNSSSSTFAADQDRGWKISSVAGTWGRIAGDEICRAEFGAGYEFAFPRSAYQNGKLHEIVRQFAASRPELSGGVWLKFNNPDFQPLPEPTVAPSEITFIMSPGGALPAAKAAQVQGSVGQLVSTRVNITSGTGQQWLAASLPPGEPRLGEGPFDVTISIAPGAQQLLPGTYTGMVQVGYQGQYSGVGDVVRVTLKVLYESTVSLSVAPNPVIASQQPVFSATVRSADPNYPIRGRVTLYEVTPAVNPSGPPIFTAVDHRDFCPINSATQTINLTAGAAGNIPLGNHTYAVRFTSEGNCMVEWLQDSDSNQVQLEVLSRLTPSPNQIHFSLQVGGALPAPVQVTPAPTVADKPAFAVTAGNNWLQVGAVSGGTAPVSLLAGARSLQPGTYRGTITVTDSQSPTQNDPGIVTVTLDVLTTITPSPANLQLVAATDVALGNLQLSAGGKVRYTADTTYDWIVLPQPNGTAPGVMQVGVNPKGKQPGTYAGNILIRSPLAPDVKAYVTMVVVAPTVVTSDPPGLTVTVDGQPKVTPVTFEWGDRTPHTLGAPRIIASSDSRTRYTFTDWNGQAANNITIEAGKSATYVARYRTTYKLTADPVPAEGGQIQRKPASPDSFYAPGTLVTLTAQPRAGYTFAGYSGDASGTAPQANVTMSAPRSLTAAFSKVQAFKVTFTSNIAGGRVIVGGTQYTTPKTLAFEPGRTYSIAAVSPVNVQAGWRYVFGSWSNGGAREQMYTATADATLNVNYTQEYLVTTAAEPHNGGTVTRGGWYVRGTSATIHAEAAKGYVFAGYSGALSGTNDPQSVVVNGPLTIKARFVRPQPPQLHATVRTETEGQAGQRIVTLRLTNVSHNPAAAVQLNSITKIGVVSGSGTATVATAMPVPFGDIAGGASRDRQIVFTWPATAKRLRFTVNFSANGGAYQGASILTLLR